MQGRQTKARLYFPLRDLERSEYNSGGRTHRTAGTDSRSPQLEVRGHEYHRSDRQLSVRWESLCPIETNCCADQGHLSWACRSRHPSSRCGTVRVSARTPPPGCKLLREVSGWAARRFNRSHACQALLGVNCTIAGGVDAAARMRGA